MSSRTTHTRLVPTALWLAGIAAVFILAVAVFTGWPPARAIAATLDEPRSSDVLLGVDESTAVAIGPAVSIDEKFEATATTATPAARARLIAPATKKPAKVAKKRATQERTKARDEKKAAPKKDKSKAKGEDKSKAEKKSRTSGWRSARASWYGPGLYGNGMAGGGKLKRDSMVVAHRSLPFGTKIRVKYRGRTVTAVVRDRGPFIKGRTFDLGPGTAKALKFDGVGTIKYKIVR